MFDESLNKIGQFCINTVITVNLPKIKDSFDLRCILSILCSTYQITFDSINFIQRVRSVLHLKNENLFSQAAFKENLI